MKEIELTKGKVAIVDDEDHAELSRHGWHLLSSGYAVRNVHTGTEREHSILMHRLIAKTPSNLLTDHINGNKLDNRRANLRTCTRSQNSANSKTIKTNTSGYRGVSWDKGVKKWRADIRVNLKTLYLGISKDKTVAAQMYNTAAQKHFGSFAKLNPI